jgi:hypothetical protein
MLCLDVKSLVSRSFESNGATGVIARNFLVSRTDLPSMAVRAFELLEDHRAPFASETVIFVVTDVFGDVAVVDMTIDIRRHR